MEYEQMLKWVRWMKKTEIKWKERDYELAKITSRPKGTLFKKGLRWVTEKILSLKSVLKKRRLC